MVLEAKMELNLCRSLTSRSCNLLKLRKKIRQEYERKEKQVEVRKKIEYSMQLNASRIKVLQAQDDLVNLMKEDAMKELLRVSHNHHEYKNLIEELNVQNQVSNVPDFSEYAKARDALDLPGFSEYAESQNGIVLA